MSKEITDGIVPMKCPNPGCKLPCNGVERPGGWRYFDCLYCGKVGRINIRTGKTEYGFYDPEEL